MRMEIDPVPKASKKDRVKTLGKLVRVMIWDGVYISPSITTHNNELEARLGALVNKYGVGQTVGVAAAGFVARSVALGLPCSIMNLPDSRSVGVTISYIQRPEFWPKETDSFGKTLAGGCFLVHLETGECEYWGGDGLYPGEELNPGIPRKVSLREVTFGEGNDPMGQNESGDSRPDEGEVG